MRPGRYGLDYVVLTSSSRYMYLGWSYLTIQVTAAKGTRDIASCTDTLSLWDHQDHHAFLISRKMKDCVTSPKDVCTRQAIG